MFQRAEAEANAMAKAKDEAKDEAEDETPLIPSNVIGGSTGETVSCLMAEAINIIDCSTGETLSCFMAEPRMSPTTAALQ
jgi:hypothetical protein